MKQIVSLLTALCSIIYTTNAQNKMTLEDCIQYALEHKQSVELSKMDEKIQKIKNDQIASATRPQVGFSGNLSGFPIVPKSRSRSDIFSFGNLYAPIDSSVVNYQAIAAAAANSPEYSELQFALPYSGSCTLSVNQILFSSDIFVALQARETIEHLTRLNTKRTEEQLRVDVTKAFYNTLIAQERIKLLDDNLELLETLTRNMEGMFKEGFVEKIDVDKLKVQSNNLKTEKEKVNNLIALGTQLLKFQMGMNLIENIIVDGKLDPDMVVSNILDDEADYGNRVEMQMMKTGKKLNEYNLIRYQKSNLPTVVAFGSLGAATGSKRLYELATLRWFPQSLIGVQVSMGFYDGGKRKKQIEEANLTLKRNDLEMESFRDAVDLESTAARTNLKNNLKSLQTQKANIALAQKVYDVAIKKNKEGLGSTLEILQAQTALKESQTNYLSALFDATISKIDLEKSLGRFNK